MRNEYSAWWRPLERSNSWSPDKTLVRAGQVGSHGIVFDAADAVVGCLASDVHGGIALRLQTGAGDHQTLPWQDIGQGAVAAVAAAVTGLLQQTHPNPFRTEIEIKETNRYLKATRIKCWLVDV